MLPFDLILRDDDLAGVGVVGVGDRMAQDADHANHLTHFGDTIGNVAGVTDELLASGNLYSNANLFFQRNQHKKLNRSGTSSRLARCYR